MPDPAENHDLLRRELGTGAAVMLGLGSILGTGVFVSIGIAAGVAGPAVILAIAIAAGVATCNALSSAQLAARFPVSGGTYEYGYATLTPALGFTAGWTFLLAKTASAATAALGCAGYLLHLAGLQWNPVPVAVGIVAVVTAVVLAGIRRTSGVNIAIVGVTLAALVTFTLAGLPTAFGKGGVNLRPFFVPGGMHAITSLLHATALMFVAYTGYGRLATLGEEVRDPARTIPRAIVVTLIVSGLLYLAVALVAIGSVGAGALAAMAAGRAAPLEHAASRFGVPGASEVVAIGAITAMLGVLLNLVLGLSRVWLAMGRRGDMPGVLARVRSGTPRTAVGLTGALIGCLTLVGDVRTTWTFSAFAVLIYYGITNLAALRLPAEARRYPSVIAWTGLVSCLGLAFVVDWRAWAAGLGLIAAGLTWHFLRQWKGGFAG